MLENHDLFQLSGIIGIVVTYVLVVIFNTVNGIGGSGIFYNTIGGLSDKYPLDITPSGWAFSIWGIIYLWLGISIVFIVFTIFKKDSDELKLYMNPPVIDLKFSFILTLNFCLNVAWLFTWDREQIVSACAVLVFMAITNAVSTGILAINLSLGNHELLRSKKIYYWAYVFVLNGMGIYTTWTVIASLLNLGHALRYVSEVSMKDTSNVSLSLLLVLSVLYFLFENTTLDKKLRFLFTPYLVLIWALTAIVTKEAGDFTILDQTKMFVASLLSISCVLAVLKIIMVIFRQKTDPIGKLYDEVDGGDLASRTSTTNYGSIF